MIALCGKNFPWYPILIITVLAAGSGWADGSLWAAGEAEKSALCIECHQELWEQTTIKRYLHPPFPQKKCLTCHAATGVLAENEPPAAEKKVNWLERKHDPAPVQWCIFPAVPKKDRLEMKVKAPGQAAIWQEIKLPPLEELEEYPDNGKPPEVSDIQVVEVENGVFVAAVICWQTDKAATSQVIYRTGRANMTSKFDEALTTVHQVRLVGLKAREKYQFTVQSADLFGNKTESRTATFSTDKSFILPTIQKSITNNNRDKELTLIRNLYRSKANYLLQVQANKPVTVAIGTPIESSSPADSPGAGPEGAAAGMKTTNKKPVDHNMRTALETNNTVCAECHGKYIFTNGHPVNVPPKRGMKFPPEYPVLANGNMTCMTCHVAHGSDNEYRLIKADRKKLCVGCHTDKMFTR